MNNEIIKTRRDSKNRVFVSKMILGSDIRANDNISEGDIIRLYGNKSNFGFNYLFGQNLIVEKFVTGNIMRCRPNDIFMKKSGFIDFHFQMSSLGIKKVTKDEN